MTENVMGIAAKRIDYLERAQNVLAQNIANIDTPGYIPKSAMKFTDMLNDRGVSISITHRNDLTPADDSSVNSSDSSISERAPDGNAVSLDQELAAVARTQIDQQYAVNIYKSYIGMFTTALGPSV